MGLSVRSPGMNPRMILLHLLLMTSPFSIPISPPSGQYLRFPKLVPGSRYSAGTSMDRRWVIGDSSTTRIRLDKKTASSTSCDKRTVFSPSPTALKAIPAWRSSSGNRGLKWLIEEQKVGTREHRSRKRRSSGACRRKVLRRLVTPVLKTNRFQRRVRFLSSPFSNIRPGSPSAAGDSPHGPPWK